MEQTPSRICLVDDEVDVLSAYSSTLESSYKVNAFISAQEALDAFDSGLEVDLLISDLKMPKMDGLSMIETLRARNFQTQIILSSGNAEKEDVVRALRLGVTNFIEKPFSSTLLKQTIAAAIANPPVQTFHGLQKSSTVLMAEMDRTTALHIERLILVENEIFKNNPRGFSERDQIANFLRLVRDGRLAQKEFDQAKVAFLKDLEQLCTKAVS